MIDKVIAIVALIALIVLLVVAVVFSFKLITARWDVRGREVAVAIRETFNTHREETNLKWERELHDRETAILRKELALSMRETDVASASSGIRKSQP